MNNLAITLSAAAGNGLASSNSNAWDIEYAEMDTDSSGYWDISTAEYIGNFSASRGANPQAIFFKPDGTKMYVTGSSSDTVKEYLLDPAWDIGSKTLNYTFSVASQAVQASGLFFKPDGSKFYVSDYYYDDIFEYDLTSGQEWNLSTASYNNVSFDVSSYETQLMSVFFKPDGTKMYTCGSAGDDINEWDLDPAWDIANASYLQRFSVSGQETIPGEVFFHPDGTKMYVLGDSGNDINEYTIPESTAWDISTASYSQRFSVSAQESSPRGMYFRPDGSRVYVIGFSGDDVNEYVLGSKILANVNAQETGPSGLFFKPDGTKMFIVGTTGDDVNEYTLDTAWDPSSASFVRNASVSSQAAAPHGLFFKSDGLTFYIIDSSSDKIYQYTCDDPWDLTTVTYTNKSFSDLREGNPQGLFFSSDGLKMYCAGSGSDSVNEFDLDTAWDVSTASYLREKSVSSEDATASGVAFSANGDKFYVVGYTNDKIYQYDLTTDWEVNTATYKKSLNIAGPHPVVRDIYFKPDGTGFFTIGSTSDDVVPWKIT